jgi:hypothetical protein
VDRAIVQGFWDMGLDTYEIALRTAFKESDVHKVVSDYRTSKWVKRMFYDQDRIGSPS